MADFDWHSHIPDLTRTAEQGDGCKLVETFALIPTLDERLEFIRAIGQQNQQDRAAKPNTTLLVPRAYQDSDVEIGLVKGKLSPWLFEDRKNSLLLEHDYIDIDGIHRKIECKDIKT